MMKNATITCRDTNITPDHKCDIALNFLADKNDLKKSIPTIKAQIQIHYLPYFKGESEQKKITELSDDLVAKMLEDWGSNGKIKIQG